MDKTRKAVYNPAGMVSPENMSKRKRYHIQRKALERARANLPEPIPGDAELNRNELTAPAPFVPERERDTRVADEIRNTLARVLGDGGDWSRPMPRRHTGIF
jgi:hypothetical protein